MNAVMTIMGFSYVHKFNPVPDPEPKPLDDPINHLSLTASKESDDDLQF